MLTLNELMRPQSHPLSQTRHHKRISSSQKSQIHREGDILRVEKDNRLISQRAVSGVDARDDVRDGRLELVSFGCGEGYLDKDDLALEFGKSLEEGFECCDFVSDALQ